MAWSYSARGLLQWRLSPFAFIEEVVLHLPNLVGLGRCHTQTVIDHEVRKLVSVDQDDLLALDSFHEVNGVLRECRSREDDPLPGSDVIHAPDEALDYRPTNWTVPPFRLDANYVQPQFVLLDHTVNAAVTRLTGNCSLSRYATVTQGLRTIFPMDFGDFS
jgi:hypothetical protein